MGVAETMHMHSLDTDTGTAAAADSGTDTVTSVFFALAPLVECVILATHDVEVDSAGRQDRILDFGNCPD